MDYKICNNCFTQKDASYFIRSKTICKDCNNNKRRTLYIDNEEHRKKLIQLASNFKSKKGIF